MSRVFQIFCFILVSLLTTGCPSGTFGLPTPRRLGYLLTENETGQSKNSELQGEDVNPLVEKQLVAVKLVAE